jgi:hypothetical protein
MVEMEHPVLIKSRLENLIVDKFEQVRKLRVVQVGEHDDG